MEALTTRPCCQTMALAATTLLALALLSALVLKPSRQGCALAGFEGGDFASTAPEGASRVAWGG